MIQNNVFKRNIKREQIASSFLNENKEILISFPPEIDKKEARYPLLLLHDGNDYFQLGRLITLTNQMIFEKRLRPLLMVAIPVNKERRMQEYSSEGKYHQAYLQFIAKELIPHLLEQHPIQSDVHERVIAGSSLGGTAALHFALQYPELCHRVLSQSGAFSNNTVEMISQSDTLESLHVYQSVGLSETALQTQSLGKVDLVARNREVYQALEEKNADVQLVEREGDHTWGLWQKDLPDALQYFFAR